MKWVGLTGGIATGKSTVAKLIESRGYPIIDADFISHQLTEVQAVGYVQIINSFGTKIVNQDQTLNRNLLATIIFNDKEKKQVLEGILHPLIQTEVLKLKEKAYKTGATICFYDVPLLFEKNMQAHFDSVILVWCDPLIQKIRLQLRNHLTEIEIQSRIDSQMAMAHKIKNASHCIDNSTDLDALKKQCESLLERLSSSSQVGSRT